MSVTRNELAESVQHNTLLQKQRAKELVDAILDLIAATLASRNVMTLGSVNSRSRKRDKGGGEILRREKH